MDFVKYLGSLQYLWMVFFIMITAGLAKEHNLFAPVFAYVRNTFRSNRFVLVIISAIGGVLPIEGRVTVSAGVLDTIAPKITPKMGPVGCSRHKFGIIDYLATHHYYMWSPLEKTVILPIAAFGLTYTAWLAQIWPLMAVSFAFIGFYIYRRVSEQDVAIEPVPFKLSAVIRNIFPFIAAIAAYVYVGGESNVFEIFGALALYYMFITQTWNWRKLASYINWEVLIVVGAVILLGTYFKTHDSEMQAIIKSLPFDVHSVLGLTIISLAGFVASFLMGSSGKFVAVAVLMAQVFGMEYFLWFFAVDYVGYLLSPTHKCTMVGNRYFGTPLVMYYKALGVWGLLLLATAGAVTFL